MPAISQVRSVALTGYTKESYSNAGQVSGPFITPMQTHGFFQGRRWTTYGFGRMWENTPNFRSARLRGTLPENEFVTAKSVIASSPVILRNRSVDGGNWLEREWKYDMYVPSLPEAPVFRSLMSTVNSGLISKAKSTQANVPVFIAEGRKSSAMITQRAMQIARAARSLRRGNFSSFLGELRVDPSSVRYSKSLGRFNKLYGTDPSKAAGNAWLEYQYGWKPLLGEVQNLTNTLLDIADREVNQYGRVSSSATVTHRQKISNEAMIDPGGYCDASFSVSESLRAFWVYRILPENIPGRLGLTNPLEVAWELVPFSFVADWFLPIGDYISSLDVGMRFAHVKGSYSSKTNTDFSWQLVRLEPNWRLPGQSPSCSGSGTINQVKVSRSRMNSAPSVNFLDLAFEPKLGSSRITSAAALIRQQVSRFSR